MRSVAIAVAGASCSGKSTLTAKLASALNASVLRIDDYYRPLDHLTFDERCEYNFDHPSAIDDVLLTTHVRELLMGRAIEAPVYDFTRHNRFPHLETVAPAPVLIVEGLFSLSYPELTAQCAIRIFVDATENVCLDRRIARDVRERGRTPDEVVHRFRHHAWPMYLQHILPCREFATMVIDGSNPGGLPIGPGRSVAQPNLLR